MVSEIINRKKLFGVTHSTDGQRIQRQVKFLKVAIGVASQGPDVHVWIAREPEEAGKPWCVEVGSYQQNRRSATRKSFATREEAEAFYLNAKKGAQKCLQPRKLSYFTFLSPGLEGGYVHDFDMIELYGPQPTEIDIVFLEDNPLDEQFRMWNATELLCQGDGMVAERKFSLATPEQQPLVKIARAKGKRFFPIIDGCYTQGCPYGERGDCKPQASLFFQLSRSPLRLGGTVWFDSRGFRSAAQLDDCLYKIKLKTGHGDADKGPVAGIPLKLCVRPFKTTYNDDRGNKRTTTAFAASVEYRADGAPNLARGLIESAYAFRDALALPAIGETSGATTTYEEAGVVELTPEQERLEAAQATAEFSGEGEFHGDGFDEFEAGRHPADAMPKRKSEAPVGAAAVEVQTSAVDLPLEIGGVLFPDKVLAENDEERMTSVDYDALTEEAKRAGLVLITYCDTLLGLKPTELTSAAAQSLLQLIKNQPTRK